MDLPRSGAGAIAVPLQNIGHRLVAHRVSEVAQCSGQAPIAPIPVFARQLQHPLLDGLRCRPSNGGPPLFGSVELLANEPTVPPQDGFRSDDLRHFPQDLAAKPHTHLGQADAFGISQS